MKRLQRAALIAALTDALRKHDSWAGETHLQKAAFMLQKLCHVPLDYSFELYRYGPFSFDLREELGEMRANGLIDRELQPYPYGPRFQVSKAGKAIQKVYGKTVARYESDIDFVAKTLEGKGVGSLERLATALWVSLPSPNAPVERRAHALTAVKPHIPLDAAEQAVQQADELLKHRATL